MKRSLPCFLAAVSTGLSAFCAQPAPDTASLMEALKSHNEEERRKAWKALAPAGAEAIAPLFDMMKERPDAYVPARRAVECIVHYCGTPDGAPDRTAVAMALAEQAARRSDRRLRAFAVRMLSYIGGDEVVRALTRLLEDAEMHEMARWALIRIPGRRSTLALADAVRRADPEFRPGLLAALGERGDPAALDAVRWALNDAHDDVRIAAMQAAARLGDASSRARLWSATHARSKRERDAARTAYLRLADALLSAGRTNAAAGMYRRIYQSDAPEWCRCAGLAGLARTGDPQSLPTILAALDAAQPRIRGVAKEALVANPGTEMTAAIAKAAEAARGARRALLIRALGRRGERLALPTLVRAASDKSRTVREAALEALGALGDPGGAITLIAALSSPEQAERDLAAASLVRLRGSRAMRAIEHAIAKSPPQARAALLRVLGRRSDYRALPTIIEALDDEDPAVRIAALDGIGRLRDPQAMPALLQALRRADGEEMKAACAALSRIRGEEAVPAMVAAIPDAPNAMKAALISALAPREDPGLANVFAEAARSDDDDVALAGLDALGRLQMMEAAPVFLEVAQKGTPGTKAAAIANYLRLADGLQDEDRDTALSIYRKALELATRDDERRVALKGLASIGDPSSLPLVRPYLERGNLRAEAAAAVVPIAASLAERGDREEAVGLLERAVELTTDRRVLREAAAALRRLGVELDIASQSGHVTHWWVLGPFGDRKRMTSLDVVPTDGPIDVQREVRDGDGTFRWKYVVVDDPLGMLDFEREVARKDDVGAYMYAEVESDSERDAVFRVGSDDSFFCWLNGQLIGEFKGDRAWAPDQTTFPAHLKKGINTILLKVLNGRAQWAASLRVTDRDGTPIRLRQRKP